MKLKAGTYYICDPCYLLDNNHSNEQTDKWVDFLDHFNFQFDGPSEYLGFPIFVHTTASGDGTYFLEPPMKRIGVDAGLIGIFSEEFVKTWNGDTNEIDRSIKAKIATKIVLDQDFEVSYDDGVFYIDTYFVDTNWE